MKKPKYREIEILNIPPIDLRKHSEKYKYLEQLHRYKLLGKIPRGTELPDYTVAEIYGFN